MTMKTNTAAAAVPASQDTPYHRAVLGFRNYWYPALKSREVGQRPMRKMLLGDPIAFVRNQGKVYAMVDECPHRGARMSLGKFEFPGSPAISCRFHGWTYDLRDGKCIAALTDGPDSPVVGKVRIKMYPIEERKGIIWVWMGRSAPAPLEEDVPALLLRPDTIVRSRHATVYGNWRYHAEGSAGGHFQMLHRDAVGLLLHKFHARSASHAVEETTDDPDGGRILIEKTGEIRWKETYGDLGNWPPARPWRGLRAPSRRGKGGFAIPLHGVMYIGLRLPGFLRVRHFPMSRAMYYEWYVAIDADHYEYFQVSGHWPTHLWNRVWSWLWYYAWAAPMRKGRFNNQDKSMVRHNTEWEHRMGRHEPTPLYRPDVFPRKWIEFCNKYARGEGSEVMGTAAKASREVTAIAGGSGEEESAK